MIKKLQDSFLYHMNIDTCGSDEEMYSAVLADLEKYGMKPPFSYNAFSEKWRDGGDGFYWDKEDDAT